jgi:hypothetical protein
LILASVSTPDPGIGTEMKDTVEGGTLGQWVIEVIALAREIGVIGRREA